LSALCLCCRDALYSHPENRNTFSNDLRGKWESNETSGLYFGILVIDFDTITIDGYEENYWSSLGDDSKRPFKDYPKRVPLIGYSEDGKIFIDYGGTQSSITYFYEGTNPQYRILEFNFWGRAERLQRMGNS
jgi:hypothetical protein